jgi:hypothetical protein
VLVEFTGGWPFADGGGAAVPQELRGWSAGAEETDGDDVNGSHDARSLPVSALAGHSAGSFVALSGKTTATQPN